MAVWVPTENCTLVSCLQAILPSVLYWALSSHTGVLVYECCSSGHNRSFTQWILENIPSEITLIIGLDG